MPARISLCPPPETEGAEGPGYTRESLELLSQGPPATNEAPRAQAGDILRNFPPPGNSKPWGPFLSTTPSSDGKQ